MSSFPLTRPSPHDVHVWQWDLDGRDGDLDGYWAMLSTEERERARQFCLERHRRRYVAGRGELRRILGRYLALSPHAVAFGYGAQGKPFCAAQPAGAEIRFNLSHSENVAALAVSNGFDVGIDIERIRKIEENVPLEVFSARECAAFNALPDAGERQAVFFENWARKEACLKALGTGFTLPPVHFEFDLYIRGDTTPRFVGGDAREAVHWRIRALITGSTCAGAVAARRANFSIVNMSPEFSSDSFSS